MVKIIRTDEVDPGKLKGLDLAAYYNGMDCMICAEVFKNIAGLLDEDTERTYRFMMSFQAVAVEMQLRGFLVDEEERREYLKGLLREKERAEGILGEWTKALWGEPLNPRSPVQKIAFFYDFLGLIPVMKYDHKKLVSKPTTDREALEHLREKYPKVRPIISIILRIMDLSKEYGTIKSGVDGDGYFRSSYNVAGTATGRLSSKKNVFGTGTNAQNIKPSLRRIFIAPSGKIDQLGKPTKSLFPKPDYRKEMLGEAAKSKPWGGSQKNQ